MNAHDLTLDNLKKKYKKCDPSDVVKKRLLKKLIQQNIKHNTQQQHIHNVDNELDKLILSQNKVQHAIQKTEKQEIFDKRGAMEQYWETQQKDSAFDPRFAEEIRKDHGNNKLMERLNIELDFRIKRNKKKVIDKPYTDIECNDFVTVKDFDKYAIPANNFKRI